MIYFMGNQKNLDIFCQAKECKCKFCWIRSPHTSLNVFIYQLINLVQMKMSKKWALALSLTTLIYKTWMSSNNRTKVFIILFNKVSKTPPSVAPRVDSNISLYIERLSMKDTFSFPAIRRSENVRRPTTLLEMEQPQEDVVHGVRQSFGGRVLGGCGPHGRWADY